MVSSQKYWQNMKGNTPRSFLFIVSLLLSTVVINGDESFSVNSNPSPDDDDDSITFKLIHRDSPRWPGNEGEPPKSQREVIKERHLRDIKRQQQQQQPVTYPLRKDGAGIKLKVESGSDIDLVGYLTEVYIGTPPRKFTLLLDTASDITWVNCHYNCKDCHHAQHREFFYGKQNRYYAGHSKKGVQVFQATRSSSFKPVPCSSIQCRAMREMGSESFCPAPSSHCMYNMSYLGGDIASGFFAEETVRAPLTTSGRTLKLKHIVIGCTETVVKLLKVDGILALGFAQSSWIDKATRNFGPKFSYCLMNFNSHMNMTSHITFGPNKKQVASHAPMILTHFFLPTPGLYGLDVTGMSLGGKMLDIPEDIWVYSNVTGGGTILDLGSSNAWLSEPAYEAVMAVYRKVFSKYERVKPNPSELPFELCFKGTKVDYASVPKLAYHFEDGAVFEPPVSNFITEHTPGSMESCVMIVKSNTYTGSLIGNVMMQNYMWEFDLEEQTVGFTPSKCV